jgi:hypothetical protein
VKLKRLKTYSPFWACEECVAKFLFIANFDKQKALAMLEREADRQVDAHVGKQPMSRQCMRGCGRHVIAVPDPAKGKLGFRIPLFCSACQREWEELGQGSQPYKPEGTV